MAIVLWTIEVCIFMCLLAGGFHLILTSSFSKSFFCFLILSVIQVCIGVLENQILCGIFQGVLCEKVTGPGKFSLVIGLSFFKSS